MMQHEMNADCWCQPHEDTAPNGDSLALFHRDEDGSYAFYTLPGSPIPYCCDCSEPLFHFMPEPSWLIRRGHIEWDLITEDRFAIGVSIDPPSDDCERCVKVQFGRWALIAFGSMRGRRVAAGERADAMAGGMIAEIEAHLRTHG